MPGEKMSAFDQFLTTVANGDDAAFKFMKSIFFIAHLWDDLIDKDKSVSDADINRAFLSMLIDLPNNPFYVTHFSRLNTVVSQAANNWIAATEMERSGEEGDQHIAFILRSSHIDVITECALIIGGRECMERITQNLRRYVHGEGFEAYCLALKHETRARGE